MAASSPPTEPEPRVDFAPRPIDDEPFDSSDPAGAPNPHAILEPGQVLDSRYRIERLARRGGMASIYRAEDLERGTLVAIKVMDRIGRSYRDRFAREAGILSGLSHPAIVG